MAQASFVSRAGWILVLGMLVGGVALVFDEFRKMHREEQGYREATLARAKDAAARGLVPPVEVPPETPSLLSRVVSRVTGKPPATAAPGVAAEGGGGSAGSGAPAAGAARLTEPGQQIFNPTGDPSRLPKDWNAKVNGRSVNTAPRPPGIPSALDSFIKAERAKERAKTKRRSGS